LELAVSIDKMNDVLVVMGSQSDWPTMQEATRVLDELGVSYTRAVVSAHRTPQRLMEVASSAETNGAKVVIAGAGGAAHLPGMFASMTHLPVVAVPVQSKALNGMDSLLSIAQMPRGIAVATQAIGGAGAFNAGVLAAQILALSDKPLAQRFKEWRAKQTAGVPWEVE